MPGMLLAQVGSIRPFAAELPSVWLDSVFAAHPERVLRISLGDSLHHVSSRFRQARIENWIDMGKLWGGFFGITGCDVQSDSSLLIAAQSGEILSVDPRSKTFSILHESGYGIDQFKKPERILVRGGTTAIFDPMSGKISIFEGGRWARNVRYLPGIPMLPPSKTLTVGFNRDYVDYVGESVAGRKSIFTYSTSGDFIRSVYLPPWLAGTDNRFGLTSDEKRVVLFTLGAPYLVVMDRTSLEVLHIVTFEGGVVQRWTEKLVRGRSGLTTEAIDFFVDAYLDGRQLYMNVFDLLVRLDLTSQPGSEAWDFTRLAWNNHDAADLSRDPRFYNAVLRIQPPDHVVACMHGGKFVNFFRLGPLPPDPPHKE